jgi:hypothetical protein
MTTDHDRHDQHLTPTELRARVVGNVLEHDEEDIRFWREASEALRGRTLYRLRARGKAMYHLVPHVIEERDDAIRLVLKPHQIEILTGYE